MSRPIDIFILFSVDMSLTPIERWERRLFTCRLKSLSIFFFLLFNWQTVPYPRRNKFSRSKVNTHKNQKGVVDFWRIFHDGILFVLADFYLDCFSARAHLLSFFLSLRHIISHTFNAQFLPCSNLFFPLLFLGCFWSLAFPGVAYSHRWLFKHRRATLCRHKKKKNRDPDMVLICFFSPSFSLEGIQKTGRQQDEEEKSVDCVMLKFDWVKRQRSLACWHQQQELGCVSNPTPFVSFDSFFFLLLLFFWHDETRLPRAFTQSRTD